MMSEGGSGLEVVLHPDASPPAAILSGKEGRMDLGNESRHKVSA